MLAGLDSRGCSKSPLDRESSTSKAASGLLTFCHVVAFVLFTNHSNFRKPRVNPRPFLRVADAGKTRVNESFGSRLQYQKIQFGTPLASIR